MNAKAASAVRRKVSQLVKGKLREFIRLDKLCESELVSFKDEKDFKSHWAEATVVERVLLYWVRDYTVGGPTAMLAGYECGEGGIGRCLFCIWWSKDRWDARIHDICPRNLDRELEDLIEEVNNEENN